MQVSHNAGEMAIPPKGVSHSFFTRTSDNNIEVENNSHITGLPTEVTVTMALHGNLCCNPQHCAGHDQDIPAETHRLDSAGLTL